MWLSHMNGGVFGVFPAVRDAANKVALFVEASIVEDDITVSAVSITCVVVPDWSG
jgi:hypothetical protein